MGSLAGRKTIREKLWREFFSYPSQWWDHRTEKVNPRYPDFKHKKTGQALWLLDNLTPTWVESELAAMAPGTLQSNIFSWNVRLQRYGQAGDHEKTMELFEQIQREGMIPDKFTYVAVLNACSHLRSLGKGRDVHEEIIARGCESDVYVATCLIDMYAKCGSVEHAWNIFDKMREPTVFSWNVMIGAFVKSGQGQKAMELFGKMQHEAVEPDAVTFVGALNACASVAALAEGKRVHGQINRRGFESNVYVATCLMDMYAKCGSIDDAWSVFTKMEECDVVSWSTMIGGYVKSGQGLKAMELFRRMQQEGVEPNAVTFVGALNACASLEALEEGRYVHEQIMRRGCESDVYVDNCLVDMYAKCGSIDDACRVFHKMQGRTVVSWNAMIGGYVKSGQGLKAMELFEKMQQEGVEPNLVTFLGVLNACASIAALEEGRRIHGQIMRKNCESDLYVATCLVDMYVRCGSIEDAWGVFDKMRERDVVSWNTMIGGYVKSGEGLKAMDLFRKLRQEGVEPNAVTFVGALNACVSVADLEEGRRVHEQIIGRGYESEVYVANCLVDMYAKCGSIEDAWNVFDKMRERTVVSWSTMIGGYVKYGQGLKAMELFEKMQQEGVEPDAVTFVRVLSACANIVALRRVHGQITRSGCELDLYVATCLVDMYARCGSIEDARSVFDKIGERDVVSWSTMIGGYVKSGQGLKAIQLFRKMQQEGVEPDIVTFVGALNACAIVPDLEAGRHVHGQIIRRGCESHVYVATCLIDMYAKCGSIVDAWSVFSRTEEHDVVCWNTMIGAFVKSGEGLKAMELFIKMEQEEVEPNVVTFLAVLSAAASVDALEEGRRIHGQVVRRGCESDVYVANCLVDMYSKCGSIEDAWSVFDKMQERDVVSWSTMIAAYVKSGQGLKAMKLFENMQQEQLKPNAGTFVGVLNACASVAALDEGRRVHRQIIGSGCESDVYVANCLVDMYAKCGSIEDAWGVFDKMVERDVVSWNAMIGGYAMHGHAKKALALFKWMDKEGQEINAVTFTCLLSACSHAGLLEEGLGLFNSMTSRYNLVPMMENYACIVDLLGRAGRLEEAEEIVKRMPMGGNATVWRSLLGACRLHGNIEMAEHAAKRCWELEPENASGHVLLSNLYAGSLKEG